MADFHSSYEATLRHFQARVSHRTLIGAVNDAATMGAICAAEEAGLGSLYAAVSQGAGPRERAEMRRPGSHLIGSITYFPEKYGRNLIDLARKILSGPPPPLVTFTRHLLVTPKSVDRLYPDDGL